MIFVVLVLESSFQASSSLFRSCYSFIFASRAPGFGYFGLIPEKMTRVMTSMLLVEQCRS